MEMNRFADLHSHVLYGVDDGAKTPKEALKMMKMAYANNTRVLCLTPHYNPRMTEESLENSLLIYKVLMKYAEEKMPDMTLILGSEIFYHNDCAKSIQQGKCYTLGESRYVLVEFSPLESHFVIQKAMNKIFAEGYIPVLAHVEKYKSLREIKRVEDLAAMGVVIQANASSVVDEIAADTKKYIRALLKKKLIHIISSDGHNLLDRAPLLGEAADYVSDHFDEDYAQKLFYQNPIRVLMDKKIKTVGIG